jgi:protein CpxP
LDLYLNQKQQDEIKSLLKKEAKEMEVTREKMKPNKSEGEKLSADEKFNIQSKSLDKQIAMKAEMKKILTAEQYIKWEAKQKNRKGQLKGKFVERKETPKNKK